MESDVLLQQNVQFLRVNRFRDIVSCGPAMFLATFHRMGCECDHRDVLTRLPFRVSQRRVQAVHFGHLYVHEDEVKRILPQRRQSFELVRRHGRLLDA